MKSTIKILFTCLLVPTMVFAAETGVTDKEIIFGQTAALDGPTKSLGINMRNGILAAFKEANDTGVIKGKVITLKSLDDGYEPNKAVENTNKLINDEHVFAIIGSVGTPTTKVIQPITTNAKIPLIGAFTGADFLRHPFNKYIVNIRSSYFQEAETWVKHLTEDLNITNIAVMYQDDAFGQTVLQGMKIALDKRNLKIVAAGNYKRNTTDVAPGLEKIKESNPGALVTVGPYKPVSECIKLAHKMGMNIPLINISFVDGDALVKELGTDTKNVIITQVVPSPYDTSVKLSENYQKAMKVYDPNASLGFVSFEGYLVGKMAVAALKNINGEITRESFVDAIYKVKEFDIDGVKLSYSDTNNQGMQQVYITKIDQNGKFISVNSFK